MLSIRLRLRYDNDLDIMTNDDDDDDTRLLVHHQVDYLIFSDKFQFGFAHQSGRVDREIHLKSMNFFF